MFMVYLLFVLSLFAIHMMAGYDSRCQKGKYITVKSAFWSKVLMGDSPRYTEEQNAGRKTGTKCLSSVLFFMRRQVLFCL